MRKGFALVVAIAMIAALTTCGNTADNTPLPSETLQESIALDAGKVIENEPSIADKPALSNGSADTEGAPEITTVPDAQGNTLYLQIGEITLTATLTERSSADALKVLLAEGPVTIEMRDYGGFEKVGELDISLPRNDEPIDAEPGDLILYQGNSLVIFYGSNTWNYTRLGKINGVATEELKNTLGSGNVSVTLSLG